MTAHRPYRRYGIRVVRGDTLAGLMVGWGHDDARDRLFQMDLARRFAAGRLAEVFGPRALTVDRTQRDLCLARAADGAFHALPREQQEWLAAYATGVNRRIARRSNRPLEHRLLRAPVERWRPEDSLLVLLGLAQQLALDVPGERSQAVLEATLPREVVAFLLPRDDEFAEDSHSDPELPLAALAEVVDRARGLPVHPVVALNPIAASNCWVVGGARTRHDGPILANDMHLGTGAPNVFRRVRLDLAGRRVQGFAVAGVPMVASGSNGDVAWGVTNIPADYTRLTPVGSMRVDVVEETIRLRGRGAVRHEVAITDAGPVLPEPLLGGRVALQWAAHRPGFIGLGPIRLLQAASAAEAHDIVTGSAGLPLAYLITDRVGAMIRTVGGRFPRRDATSLLPGEEDVVRLPRRHGGPTDVLVTTNDPPSILTGQTEVGRNYPTSYRRSRIHQLLMARTDWDEESVAAVQQDARAGLLDFYLRHARDGAHAAEIDLRASVLAALDSWDGSQSTDSRGSALLWVFRVGVQQELMSRLLRECASAEPGFKMAWRNPEPVIRRLLHDRPPELTGLLDPPPAGGEPWTAFLADRVRDAAAVVIATAGKPVVDVRWGDVVSIRVAHPLGGTRWTRWLNLRPLAPVGGPESVAAYSATRGPVQRLVVSPGREQDGLVGMPGGQSGNPLSPHYRDQHRDWRRGRLARLAPPTPGGAR